ncbi:MAG TPA: hypothetical protein PLW14_05945 [Chlorobiota bacterium]|nr:hypothetical protein [Chlorobiota bacterium]
MRRGCVAMVTFSLLVIVSAACSHSEPPWKEAVVLYKSALCKSYSAMKNPTMNLQEIQRRSAEVQGEVERMKEKLEELKSQLSDDEKREFLQAIADATRDAGLGKCSD